MDLTSGTFRKEIFFRCFSVPDYIVDIIYDYDKCDTKTVDQIINLAFRGEKISEDLKNIATQVTKLSLYDGNFYELITDSKISSVCELCTNLTDLSLYF